MFNNMKYFTFLTIILLCSTFSFAQSVHSKYPCDTTETFDILLSGATFSGTKLEKQLELQNIIYSLKDYKSINGQYFVNFVVKCDGTTKNINNKHKGNTINIKTIEDFMTNLATENNWSPAIHRETRVPHRKTISITVKKGKIKEFNI